MRVYYVHKCTYNEKGTMKGVEMCAKRWRGKKGERKGKVKKSKGMGRGRGRGVNREVYGCK